MENLVKASVSNEIVSKNGLVYTSIRQLANTIGVSKTTISNALKKNGCFNYGDDEYRLKNANYAPIIDNKISDFDKKDIEDYLEYKSAENIPFERMEFEIEKKTGGVKYAVALFSDAHIEETVTPSSVLGLNEYNIEIAEKRIMNYFCNLVRCLNADGVDSLIFASLGDTISGYIHDELAQTNCLSPLEAIFKAQNLIYNGLELICNNTMVDKIMFVGIVGNHSRTTKKIQHSNGYKLSYEWLMYKNIEKQCKLAGLPIDFLIPESEMGVVDTIDDRRFLFVHGFQIKSGGNGTVCGIYPSLNRLSMKWDRTFHQDKIYLGHFHSCISIPNATVNGSIIGFNSYSLTNGFQCEEPAQMYELYDSNIGLLLTRKIYCD